MVVPAAYIRALGQRREGGPCYDEMRTEIERRGGEMYHIKEGTQYGAWVIRIRQQGAYLPINRRWSPRTRQMLHTGP